MSAQAQLAITSRPNFGTVTIGQVDFQLTATGGVGPHVWSFVAPPAGAGPAPAGLAFHSDLPPWFPAGTTEALSGIVTTPGTYAFTIQVSDGVATAQQDITVKITGFVVKTPWDLPDAFQDVPYAQQLQVFGFAAGGTLTWTPRSPMPSGLSLSDSGLLSGTPTSTGPFRVEYVEYKVSDGTDTIFGTHRLQVYPVRIVTDGMLPFATVNRSYTQTITASGGTGGHTFELFDPLPEGVTFDGNTISGTPTESGRWTFTVTARDSTGQAYFRIMSLVVVGAPGELPQVQPYDGRLNDCTAGVPCLNAISNWSGARPPFAWAAAGLPPGMSLRQGSGNTSTWVDPGDVELWGTPTVADDYNVTVTLTDGTGATATNTFPLHVSTLSVSNYPAAGKIGVPYAFTFRVLGGSGSYSGAPAGGTVPLGLSWNGGSLSLGGTPTEGGSFDPQFRFEDGQGQSLTFRVYSFSIANAGNPSPPLDIDLEHDFGFVQVGQVVGPFQFPACCRASLNWTLESGTPPPGITMSLDGVVDGAPTTPGPYDWVVRATDASQPADFTTRHLKVIVTPIGVTTSAVLPGGFGNEPYSEQLRASGSPGPYKWTLAPGNFLPPGLRLTTDGVLTGAPITTGAYSFEVRILDETSHELGVGYFFISIYPSRPAKAAPVSPAGAVTTATPSFTWSAVPMARYYVLWIADSSADTGQQWWYTPLQAGCATGTGTCTVAAPRSLRAGRLTWKVLTWNTVAYGDWSSLMTAVVDVADDGLATPTPLAPAGNIGTRMPTYAWDGVGGGVTGYQVSVTDAIGTIREFWFTPAEACAASACAATPTAALAAGPARWQIRAWRASGRSAWSALMDFNAIEVQPGKAGLVAPSGSVATFTPAFTWSAVSNVSYYLLRVVGSDNVVSERWYTPAGVGCTVAPGTCTAASTGIALKAGPASWRVLTWNATGYGPWSDQGDLIVEVADPLAVAPVTLGPSGTITSTNVPYRWTAVAGALTYRLSIRNNGGAPVYLWYSPAAAGCDAAAECGAVPLIAIANGTVQWQVQSWTASGYSTWSPAITLTVNSAPPAAPVLTSPSGTAGSNAGVFTWNASASATYYYVQAFTVAGLAVDRWIRPASAGCASGGVCTLNTGGTLASGAATWQVIAWNPTGYSEWSAVVGFIVP